MVTGNGTIGALVRGNPLNEIIILSHEKLFLPEYPPTMAPDIGSHLQTIRELVLAGKGEEAAELAVKLGVEAGIEDLIWTDPLIPACQIEIESLTRDSVLNYARSVNYETRRNHYRLGNQIREFIKEKCLYHERIVWVF